MKVYVVMGNDYPDAVFATKARAEEDVAEKVARNKVDRVGGRARKIYWRFYEFEVKE